jgi:hypothetical protein
MFDPDSQEDRLLFLLNSFAGSVVGGPWVLGKNTQYHMDAFGESIRVDDTYFARRSGNADSRRLSVHSARLLWDLLIEDNGRQEEFRENMIQAQRELQRGEAEAGAESYEDMHGE